VLLIETNPQFFLCGVMLLKPLAQIRRSFKESQLQKSVPLIMIGGSH